MGMISDCYQLQENQRKNGPLAVKTPSPPAGADRLPCWPAVRRTYPRRSLAPLRSVSPSTYPPPSPLPLPQFPAVRAKSSRARSPAKPCASTAPGECRKGTETSIHGGEGMALYGRDQAQGGEVSPGRSGRSGRRCGKGLPWCLCPFSPSPLLTLLILRAPALLILRPSGCPRCCWPAWLPPFVLLRLVELGARWRF